MQNSMLDTAIEYLKGVGPLRGELLKKELQIFTARDLMYQFPFRYVDKTKIILIKDINEEIDYVQIKGVVRRVEVLGEHQRKRLVVRLRDQSGAIDLVWFQGVHWLQKQIAVGQEYLVFGRINIFKDQINITHPEIELVQLEGAAIAPTFDPVYSSTEKLNAKGLDTKGRRRIIKQLFELISEKDLQENLPDYIIQKFRLCSRYISLNYIHFPPHVEGLEQAKRRLKFEELFLLQLRLLQMRHQRHKSVKGHVFDKIGSYFNDFYNLYLPFELTNAQKRVLKEIRKDMGSGIQMNRLLQGDVGSGKTIVALIAMLMALDNGFQACLMAPTEILAQQHFNAISELVKNLGIEVGFLTGSIKGKQRTKTLDSLSEGNIKIIIGTHALIEENVKFKNLGLAIVDEQHRFGVAQRGYLWKKSHSFPPHILVMTATPIPRTLAMTLYGDLDVSIIDELPPGRKEIKTTHRTEKHRLSVIGFMKEEIAQGRQIYVVYPLIEESETLDLQNLMSGYESLLTEFPMPQYQISIVHGKMKPADKDFEMQRFINKETQIMIATTVIEVGVNVPNASVMIIENTERFGLSQLHQLRGRVGRGADQSYCILMSSYKLSADAKERISIMCQTNNGFEISEADLKLRGPGNIEGTQQSGLLNLRIADLAKDGRILQTAREVASEILQNDPYLEHAQNEKLNAYLKSDAKAMQYWSRIS